jgi:hypothetical protein
MPVALLVLLWAGLTCAHEPAADEISSLSSAHELLASACERALAGLAPDAGPAPLAPVSLPAEVGPALRALRAMGMGGRVAALEAAVERAARLALADARPDLERAVEGFAPEDAQALVSGEGDALSAAFRAAAEADLRAGLAAVAEQRLEDAGAPAALEGVRNGAARLPLPRKADLDLVSVVTDHALGTFFIALSDAERQLRRERVALHNE